VPASVDQTIPEQRILETSMVLPAGGAVTGWAALRLHGARFFDGLGRDGTTPRPVPLVLGPGLHRPEPPGIVFLRDRLGNDDVCTRQGIPCTIADRALFDEMRRSGGVRQAVECIDMAAAAELTSLSRFAAYVAGRAGWDGVPLVRAAIPLADENSRSPRETELRLIWVLDARLPRPLVNREVFDRRSGRMLGVADLLDPASGLVGEFDGGEHAGARRRSRDAERDRLFRDHGLEVFRVTFADLARPADVVQRAHATYERARRINPELRTWTVEPPPGWERPRSLEEVLAERDLLREMHERWADDGEPDIHRW
jgi:very-short-patch-repair endonuclease